MLRLWSDNPPARRRADPPSDGGASRPRTQDPLPDRPSLEGYHVEEITPGEFVRTYIRGQAAVAAAASAPAAAPEPDAQRTPDPSSTLRREEIWAQRITHLERELRQLESTIVQVFGAKWVRKGFDRAE